MSVTTNKKGRTKVLVLLDCQYGKCGQSVALNDADLKAAKEQGMVDPTPEAVASGFELPDVAVEEAAAETAAETKE
jgi:hypothetical protein